MQECRKCGSKVLSLQNHVKFCGVEPRADFKSISVAIELPEAPVRYYSQERVSGTLFLSVGGKSPLLCQELRVSFEGHEQVRKRQKPASFVASSGSRSDSGAIEQLDTLARRQLYKEKGSVLLQDVTCDPGDYEVPFFFDLPAWLPASAQRVLGDASNRVGYVVVAALVCASLPLPLRRECALLVGGYHLPQSAVCRMLASGSSFVLNDRFDVPGAPNAVSLRAFVPARALVVEEAFEMSVLLNNEARGSTVTRVSVLLRMSSTASAEGHVASSSLDFPLSTVELELAAGDSSTIECHCEGPRVPGVTSVSRLMTTTFQLVVQLEVRGASVSLVSVQTPILLVYRAPPQSSALEAATYSGSVDAAGLRHGEGMVVYESGDSFHGVFRHGVTVDGTYIFSQPAVPFSRPQRASEATLRSVLAAAGLTRYASRLAESGVDLELGKSLQPSEFEQLLGVQSKEAELICAALSGERRSVAVLGRETSSMGNDDVITSQLPKSITMFHSISPLDCRGNGSNSLMFSIPIHHLQRKLVQPPRGVMTGGECAWLVRMYGEADDSRTLNSAIQTWLNTRDRFLRTAEHILSPVGEMGDKVRLLTLISRHTGLLFLWRHFLDPRLAYQLATKAMEAIDARELGDSPVEEPEDPLFIAMILTWLGSSAGLAGDSPSLERYCNRALRVTASMWEGARESAAAGYPLSRVSQLLLLVRVRCHALLVLRMSAGTERSSELLHSAWDTYRLAPTCISKDAPNAAAALDVHENGTLMITLLLHLGREAYLVPHRKMEALQYFSHALQVSGANSGTEEERGLARAASLRKASTPLVSPRLFKETNTPRGPAPGESSQPHMSMQRQLMYVLRTPSVCALFENYLRKHYCEENLMFWKRVEEFRQREVEDQAELLRQANIIYDRYLAPTAEDAINILGDIKAHLRTRILGGQPLHPHIFQEAQYAVESLMARDSVKGFFLSEVFRERVGLAKARREIEKIPDTSAVHVEPIKEEPPVSSTTRFAQFEGASRSMLSVVAATLLTRSAVELQLMPSASGSLMASYCLLAGLSMCSLLFVCTTLVPEVGSVLAHASPTSQVVVLPLLRHSINLVRSFNQEPDLSMCSLLPHERGLRFALAMQMEPSSLPQRLLALLHHNAVPADPRLPLLLHRAATAKLREGKVAEGLALLDSALAPLVNERAPMALPSVCVRLLRDLVHYAPTSPRTRHFLHVAMLPIQRAPIIVNLQLLRFLATHHGTLGETLKALGFLARMRAMCLEYLRTSKPPKGKEEDEQQETQMETQMEEGISQEDSEGQQRTALRLHQDVAVLYAQCLGDTGEMQMRVDPLVAHTTLRTCLAFVSDLLICRDDFSPEPTPLTPDVPIVALLWDVKARALDALSQVYDVTEDFVPAAVCLQNAILIEDHLHKDIDAKRLQRLQRLQRLRVRIEERETEMINT